MPKLKLLYKSDEKKKKAAAVAAVAAAVETASQKVELRKCYSEEGTLRGYRTDEKYRIEEKRRTLNSELPVNNDIAWHAGPEVTQLPLSRKNILSKSRECLSELEFYDETEDIWFNKDQLLRDHLREVLDKWDTIDDEIWGKIICMERNRRVAKAYARVPVLTISGANDGFDGFRIGLNGFDNPRRDPEVDEIKKHIGHGIKLKMDNDGNILAKKVSKNPVFLKGTNSLDDNCFPADIIDLHGLLEYDKPMKIFDMKKFTHNISKELKGPYPDRRKLELQCFMHLGFVKDYPELLDTPCWIMVINIVALDMLKSKLPPAMMQRMQRHSVPDVGPRNLTEIGPRIGRLPSIPREALENPYPRLTNDLRPPKLPPRELPLRRDTPLVPMPDYTEDYDHESPSTSEHDPSLSSSVLPSEASERKVSADVYQDSYAVYRQRSYPGEVKAEIVRYNQSGSPFTVTPNHRHSRSYDSGLAGYRSNEDDWF